MSERSALKEGRFLDKLKELVVKKPKDRDRYGNRKSVAMLRDSGKTVKEIYELSGIDVAMSEEDTEFLGMLEKVSEEEKEKVRTLCCSLCDCWWDELDNSFEKTGDVLAVFLKHKYSITFRNARKTGQNPEDMRPFLHSLISEHGIPRISTDDIPKLAQETDTSISFFFPADKKDVRFYTMDKAADMAFADFKMLEPEMRIIPYAYLKAVYERKEGNNA